MKIKSKRPKVNEKNRQMKVKTTLGDQLSKSRSSKKMKQQYLVHFGTNSNSLFLFDVVVVVVCSCHRIVPPSGHSQVRIKLLVITVACVYMLGYDFIYVKGLTAEETCFVEEGHLQAAMLQGNQMM